MLLIRNKVPDVMKVVGDRRKDIEHKAKNSFLKEMKLLNTKVMRRN